MRFLEVLPGYQFAPNELVTIDKLNAGFQPVVSLTTELFNLLSSFKNGFINGNLQVWQRGTTARSCSAGAKTWRADRWFARPAGAAITYARSSDVPAGSVARYSALLTGAASVTTVDFGQRIESGDAYSDWQRERTFSAWIYNDTGGSFIPKLRINTPGAADNYASNTNRLDQVLQACPSGGWTQVSHTFDGSTLENVANGVEIVLQLPDGAMNASGKSVKITSLQCEPGPAVTAQEPRLITHELILCQRYLLRLTGEVIGFAQSGDNLENKGLLTYPTSMRIKPVFEGTVGNTGTEDNYFTVNSGNRGTPLISSYASATFFGIANSEANWTATAQVQLNAILSAEDQS